MKRSANCWRRVISGVHRQLRWREPQLIKRIPRRIPPRLRREEELDGPGRISPYVENSPLGAASLVLLRGDPRRHPSRGSFHHHLSDAPRFPMTNLPARHRPPGHTRTNPDAHPGGAMRPRDPSQGLLSTCSCARMGLRRVTSTGRPAATARRKPRVCCIWPPGAPGRPGEWRAHARKAGRKRG